MKNVLVPVIFFLLFSSVAFPQNSIRLTISSGFNYTSLEKADYYENFRSLPGFIAGAETEFYVSENVLFSTGLNYSERRYKSVVNNYPVVSNYNYSFDYLSFNFSFRYLIPVKSVNLFIYGGPNLAILLKGTSKALDEGNTSTPNAETTRDISDLINEADLGLLIGNAVSINVYPAVSLVLAGEYMFSLTDHIKDENFENYFRNLGFRLGVSFKL